MTPPVSPMLIEYIKNIPLFKQLKDSQLRELAARCKGARFKKGEVIFYRTDLSTDLYIVNSGKLKAVLADDEGDEIVIAQFAKGDFFGEFSLLDGKGR
jgi:CRP/FNR family cyclic AMP-dependent transcriptional regulator